MTAFIEEFATWQAAEGSWFFRGWPLPNPDPILRATGNALPVYRSMLYDAHIGGLARRRRAAVKALDWKLETGKAKAKTVRLVQEALTRLDVPAIVGGMWEAALFGYACAEVMWEKRESHVLPRAVIAKPQEWFTFDSEGTLLFMAMGSANGVPVPPRKFLLARQDATLKNPYGIADLARCFWPHTFKKGGLQFWLKFVEKYGAPKLVGKFDRQTSAKEQEDLLALLEACVQDASWSYRTTTAWKYWGRTAPAFPGLRKTTRRFCASAARKFPLPCLGRTRPRKRTPITPRPRPALK